MDVEGGNSNSISMNFQTTFIDNAPTYGCARVDDTTHWTTIFGELQTEYNGASTGVERANDGDINIKPCYVHESLAINLNHAISPDGTCGGGMGAYRCDDGSCCSSAG